MLQARVVYYVVHVIDHSAYVLHQFVYYFFILTSTIILGSRMICLTFMTMVVYCNKSRTRCVNLPFHTRIASIDVIANLSSSQPYVLVNNVFSMLNIYYI